MPLKNFSSFPRSNGHRWNAYRDALRPVPLERHNLHSHAKHGERETLFACMFSSLYVFLVFLVPTVSVGMPIGTLCVPCRYGVRQTPERTHPKMI
jgi:hypothetical protein